MSNIIAQGARKNAYLLGRPALLVKKNINIVNKTCMYIITLLTLDLLCSTVLYKTKLRLNLT